MIAAHQPTIFGNKVVAAVSSINDGSMKFIDRGDATIKSNIMNFLRGNGVSPKATAYLGIHYDKTDFTQYTRVSKLRQPLLRIDADGLATDVVGSAIFLPLADCTGAIFYDPQHNVLMVSHLGRHSTEQYGARKSIDYLHATFRSDPSEILVWLSPSPNGSIYPLWARDNMSLIEANRIDLINSGIAPGHIEIAPVDTATDHDYFSHSEFLKGRRTRDGRYAIMAQLA